MRTTKEYERLRVLLIDDEKMMRDIVVATLETTHPQWQIITSDSGPGGIRSAKHDLPDIILLDVDMPHFDGLQTLKIIREDPAICRIPVVLFTATGSQSYRVHNPDWLITKPFDPIKLGNQINNAYAIHESAQTHDRGSVELFLENIDCVIEMLAELGKDISIWRGYDDRDVPILDQVHLSTAQATAFNLSLLLRGVGLSDFYYPLQEVERVLSVYPNTTRTGLERAKRICQGLKESVENLADQAEAAQNPHV